mmetsp:Transcript_18121/g.25540  ORF Transcript_18121/g.25540 Transcript_18121/m.25540 type:complete len:290 (+) Transcript_18121:112-981(+)
MTMSTSPDFDNFDENNSSSTSVCTRMALSDSTNLHTNNNPVATQEEQVTKIGSNISSPPSTSLKKNDLRTNSQQPCDDEEKNNHNYNDPAYWRNMFYALQKERVTAAEAQYYALTAEISKREEALKNYAMYLEEEVKSFKTKQQTKEQEVTNLKLQLDAKSTEIRQKEKEIDQYHMMTGMTFMTTTAPNYGSINNDKMMVVEEQEETTKHGVIDCTVENEEKKSCAQFRISPVNDGNNENNESIMLSRYEPIQGCEKLPRFLQSAIEFETKDCPSLLRNVLKGVFPDDE